MCILQLLAITYTAFLNNCLQGLSATPLIEKMTSNLFRSNKQPRTSPAFQQGIV